MNGTFQHLFAYFYYGLARVILHVVVDEWFVMTESCRTVDWFDVGVCRDIEKIDCFYDTFV
jgi:hypothetical protein